MSATSTAITWPTSWPARAAAVYSCDDPWNPATPIEVDYFWRRPTHCWPARPMRPSPTRPRCWTSGSRSAPRCPRSWSPSISTCRGTAAKRKLFRQTRNAIAEKSAYARKKMLDTKGVLNPGLMPSKLENLQLLAPSRNEVDDVLVERWNRVVEVWRNETEFRAAVLRYATSGADRDPASASLWPEVVYPLIERARWHRRIRSRTESAWDYIWGGMLHLPDAGVVLDRAIERVVPAPLAAQLEESLNLMFDNPPLDDEDDDPFAPAQPVDQTDRLTASITGVSINLADLAQDEKEDKGLMRLVDLDPIRFSQGELHELWKEALQALQKQVRAGAKPASHRPVPVGPYQLSVIPSVRGHAAGQIAIQGMSNKQIEISTPTVRTKGSAGKALLAVWVYRDHSLAHGSSRFP